MNAPGIVGPRPWLGDAARPDVPAIDGLPHHSYGQTLERTSLALHDNGGQWTIAVTDPRSEWWGVVLSGPGRVHTWWFVGNAAGVVRADYTTRWPWEAVDGVRHVITCEAFSDAHRAGTLGQYWTAATDDDTRE